ncbi:hypothetical protein PsorP6_009650 [Peronosclerospora sorghi]|uniref:Uncharacterized protein n=1 Tax=Peronosclerospora sorghi TaxID=230839 RepID=A0ACC0VZ81_9STRA|nr:hypothetical protein PsorP6_009650 [Peronosclerospora sorghi]
MLTRLAHRHRACHRSFCRGFIAPFSTGDNAASDSSQSAKLVKRKVAIVAGYLGTGYHGLQLNNNVITIEEELRHAVFKAGAMRESNFEDLGKIDWSRSSRTDKGVHAGCIVFSGKLLIDEENKVDSTTGRVKGLTEALNATLPISIRVFSCTRVNKRFSARKNCVLREYEYVMPVSFFQDSVIGSDRAKLNVDRAFDEFCDALRRYEGVHDFHNFTRSRSHFYKVEAKRKQAKVQIRDEIGEVNNNVMVEVEGTDDDDTEEIEGSTVHDYCDDSSQYEDEEGRMRKVLVRHRRSIYSCTGHIVTDFFGEPYVRVLIVGQAFLLNQIRCMIGGALAVATKGMSRVAFDAALSTNRIIRVPIAPAEGLILRSSTFGGRLHTVSLYEDINTALAKERKDLLHRVLLNHEEDKAVQKFRTQVIYKEIFRNWDMKEKRDRWRAYIERCYESNSSLREDDLLSALHEQDQAKLRKKTKRQSIAEKNPLELDAFLPRQFTTKLCVRYSLAPGIFTSDVRRALARRLATGKIPLDAKEAQLMDYIDHVGLKRLATQGRFGGDGNPFGVQFSFGDFPQRFDEHYRVYPVSFCDKAHLEDGDKTRLHIEYPMLFKVTNEGVERSSHCGVLEFSASEGSCYMPYWMMQNLFVKEGGILNIQNVSLPKATFVKLRPQSQDFLDISNPRAVLEGSLRKFSCMTVGDTICLKYNNKNYMLDVREVKPSPAACIIETDCEVDFEPPADYIPPAPVRAAAAPSNIPYGGVPTMKAEEMKPAHTAAFGSGLRLKKKGESSSTDAAALRAARLSKYEAFHGTGQSLNGTTSVLSSADSGSSRVENSKFTLNGGSGCARGAKPSVGYRLNGEAVNLTHNNDEEQKAEPVKKSEPFQGEGRRLR